MANWDAGKFLKTIVYFDAVPIFSDLRRWFSGDADRESITDGGRTLGLILVIGAVGKIGQSVVAQLLASGYRVRATVQDLGVAQAILPTTVELVQLELDELTDNLGSGIRAIVACPDGDNLSIRLVEQLIRLASKLPITTERELFDFTQPKIDTAKLWGNVDDVVMGGVSESNLKLGSDCAIFSGRVLIDNSGGFASVRTRNFEPSLDLTGSIGIQLQVKGDGQRYKLFIRTETAWDGVGYAYSFDTIRNDWITIQIPFKKLVPIFRAKTVDTARPIDISQIRSLQIMLSKFEYDRQLNPHFTPGLFTLQISKISAYGGSTLPQLILINSDPVAPELTAALQATQLPYSIVKFALEDPYSVAATTVKSLIQPVDRDSSIMG
jgi:Complex I intermediate-associated protein 30 (CIA30)/NmrA-like family